MRFLFALTLLVFTLTCGACDSTDPEADADITVIDVLFAYTPDVEVPDEFVERSVHETNEVYAENDVPIRLRVAYLTGVDYEPTDRLQNLERLMRTDDGHLDEIHELRDAHQADVGVLLVDDRSLTVNGAVLADETTAFAVVFWETLGAPDYALAHEVGHLLGARHSPDNDPRLEPFPYGHGFRNDTLKTIMSSAPLPVVPYFSGPDAVREGLVLGDSSLHDVRRVLRETAAYVSNFRGPQTPTDFVPPGTWPTVPIGD